MKKWGPETTISVFVKSVIFLNERTAAIRFQTTRKSERETVATDWVANVRFRYTSEPMRNDWRFDNPLGFQALEVSARSGNHRRQDGSRAMKATIGILVLGLSLRRRGERGDRAARAQGR